MKNQPLAETVKRWLLGAGELIKKRMKDSLVVSTKSNRSDLVTNVDKEVQQFLVERIEHFYSNDNILAEEDGRNHILNMDGRVWVIDPIDGTLNFVFQRENFAIMVGIYEKGIGQLGFLYDVVKEELYWGGVGIGVFCNDHKLSSPKNLGAKDGLWGMNGAIYAENIDNVQKIGKESMGVRIIGSAGIEFISLLRGNTVGYISNLYPWDYAAGMILANEFGFKGSFLDGSKMDFQGRAKFIVATEAAYIEAMENIANF